ncbi:MAG: FAD/NAD(P)-binding protein, partial [Pyrinomonadaceae bacterium]|nr:FAD/NAD(P)-binding protein [Pyrinomonadaceae bacterium]
PPPPPLFVSLQSFITNGGLQRSMMRITIIGGGASGTLLAINLIRNSGGEPIEVNMIESRQNTGRGVAYSTGHDRHLLNVPAGKMSAFPDEPGHFFEWLKAKGHNFNESDFVPRKLYGDYLSELLHETAENHGAFAKFNLIADEAVDIIPDRTTAEVVLRSGNRIASDRVVLAFGNAAPPHPSVPDLSFTSSPKYVRDVWNASAYGNITPDDNVLIIGTGLSMIDTAIRLHSAGHRGSIMAISTRGMLPQVHELGHTYPDLTSELAGLTRITDMLKTVRRHIRLADSNGGNWRGVIDSLRPVTQQLWRQLPDAEKRYFMQHLSRYWNSARHRMPPAAADTIAGMIDRGELRITKGRLKEIRESEGRFTIYVSLLGRMESIHADAILNCIAAEANFARHESTLVQNLIAAGVIRCDGLALGLDALPNGAIIGKTGERSQVIFTLGTALKGILWETTAIPEIRMQAGRLATELLSQTTAQ